MRKVARRLAEIAAVLIAMAWVWRLENGAVTGIAGAAFLYLPPFIVFGLVRLSMWLEG